MSRDEQMEAWFNYRGDAPDGLARALRQSGASIERRSDGGVAVSGMPKPHVSNPSFLSDEVADWQAREARRNPSN
jgi:hypothetical protein